ncbi:MAG: 30S ribosomal protein S16 [Actinomycetota bacterium]|nr:30S ribosomal protein S16 [Actinomycetota bacterium]MDQ2957944.1 30S ribosomal protein S16 [Actinomycetota bacterium]
MATKIKLTRVGKMREPHYRVVIADARTKRDGRSIETIGEYHPKNDPSVIRIDADRAAYWLGVGAQPTEAVTAILKVTGDWQKFKGLPAPEPMKFAAPKPDKRALFDAALKDSEGEPSLEATTPKKRAAKKAAEPVAEATEAPAAEAPVAEAPAAEAPAAEATETAEASTAPADGADS